MFLSHETRKWGEILLPILLLGGAGGVGLEWQGAERYADNAEYVDSVSVEMLELELKYTTQIAELSARVARLEGSHEKD